MAAAILVDFLLTATAATAADQPLSVAEAKANASEALSVMQAVATSERNAHNGWVSNTAGIGVYGNEYFFRAMVADCRSESYEN